jgi:hypothetical protein
VTLPAGATRARSASRRVSSGRNEL